MRTALIVTALAVLAVARPGAVPPPNLAGYWVADTSRSDYGRMPAPVRLSDHIECRGREVIIVSSMQLRGRKPLRSVLRLTANGEEAVAVINGARFLTRCWWDRDKLVIRVTDSRGASMTEIRSLSKDGTEMTVESYLGDASGRPTQRRVMRHEPRV